MQTHFHLLGNEVDQFMYMQGNPVAEFSDSQWLCDIAFVVDFTNHLSQLNKNNQLLNVMLAKVKSIKTN